MSAGDSLTFTVLNINCADPNATLEVPVDGGPETMILLDDGVWPDVEANDGIYVAQRQWFASEVGEHTLTFPNNDVVTVHVISTLAPYAYSTAVPFNYRDIAGTRRGSIYSHLCRANRRNVGGGNCGAQKVVTLSGGRRLPHLLKRGISPSP